MSDNPPPTPTDHRFARADLIAIGLIAAGYALALLVMPPSRDFALLDDWNYARSVERIIAGSGFAPSNYAQMTLITHAYWGALCAALFGDSFTTLTAATMAMSFLAAATFYLLLRRLGFSTGKAGIGVALLCFNPYFLYLSYTYMTEVTFVALTLLATLFYYIGLSPSPAPSPPPPPGEAKVDTANPKSKIPNLKWLWLASLVAALAFLTRQFALALPLAALLWLLYARRLNTRNALAVALLPTLAAIGYFVWSSGFGPTFSGSVGRNELADLVNPRAWATRFSHFAYLELFLPGLMIPLLGRVRHWRITALLSLAAAAIVFILWQVKIDIVQRGAGDVSELSYDWLHSHLANPTWVYCLGAAMSVWLFAGLLAQAWPGLVALIRRQRDPQPLDFLYAATLIMFLGTFAVSAGFLDRYWLPLWPLLIAAALYRFRDQPIRRLAPALALFLLVAAYGIALHLDDYAESAAYWQAGRDLVQQGVAYDHIRSSYTWEGYYLYDEASKRLGVSDVSKNGATFPPDVLIDPQYVVSTAPQPGYRVIKAYPYLSIRGGFVNKDVLVMQRQ